MGAYVLLADPAYLLESVESYYHVVDTIVMSFDQDSISWTGEDLDIEPCVSIVERLDRDHKVRFVPGRFHGDGRTPIELETLQRNAAISSLGDSVDWILQIDSDEVVASPSRLVGSIGLGGRPWTLRGRVPVPVALRPRGRAALPRALPAALGCLGHLPRADRGPGRNRTAA